MKKTTGNIAFFFKLVLLILAAGIPALVLAQSIQFKWNYEAPPAQCIWIGILQGTWEEMGIQYGQKAARDIRLNFDTEWENTVVKYRAENPWHKGKASLDAREKYAVAYLRKSYEQLSYFGPELIEFMRGIGKGAESELVQCRLGKTLTPLDKIEFLNFGGLNFHPSAGETCNAAWVNAKATKSGETLACRAGQGNFTQDYNRRQVAYVALPSDMKAPVFWAQATAGAVALSGSIGLLTDRGVIAMSAGAPNPEALADETLAPGAKDFPLATYVALFAKNAREATEMFTTGTERYRAATGRKTVLRARGSNVIFADANEAFCVESNARHYAIRTPGYMGEKGNDYLVIANDQQYKDGSYNEENVLRKDQPMTKYCPQGENSSTYYRFWTGMWAIANNYGKIDREMMLRDISVAHYAFDRNGTRHDVDPETGAPSVPGTFCAHSGRRTTEYPLGTGGNDGTSIYALKSLEVYWVPAWPCLYKEKNWNYLDLKPYVQLRRASAFGSTSSSSRSK